VSIDIPVEIEPEILKYARSEHISSSEAVFQLIKAGLALYPQAPPANAILNGLGMFSGDEDAALLDEVVAIAYEERRRPSGQSF
jgi:hypothetical protein